MRDRAMTPGPRGTPATPSLGLDLSGVTAQLGAAAGAARTLTDTAQATLTAVPRLPDPPAWFQPIAADLATAQSHARSWLDQLCPAMTDTAPRSVLALAEENRSTLDGLIGEVAQLVASGAAPTEDQRAAVDATLAAMTSALGAEASATAGLAQELSAYAADLAADQDRLGDDLGDVAQRFADAKAWITDLQATLGEHFLDSTALGPCLAIVEIDMAITLKVHGVSADPTVLSLVVARAILDSRVAALGQSLASVQEVEDAWATVGAKVGAVRTDLADAADADYLPILTGADLDTARQQWDQLATYASTLLPSSTPIPAGKDTP